MMIDVVLVGPCALEFTRVKTSDHLWTDPHADELVQRHRMHSQHRTPNNSNPMMMNMNNSRSRKFRPSLQINVSRNRLDVSPPSLLFSASVETSPKCFD